MPAVSVLMKPASGMCNMACKYCFYCDEMANREIGNYGFMTEETLKNIIRRTIMRSEGMASYAYQGGEPTLRGLDFFKKAVEYQKKYNRNHIRIQNALQTNGLLIDENWCRFLKENDFLVGLSLDGIACVHDKNRLDKSGLPTFDRVLKTIDLFNKYDVKYNILTVVTNEVSDHIEEIYAFYKSKNLNFQQYIPCLDPFNSGSGNFLSPGKYAFFLNRLFKLWYEDFKSGTQPYIRQFENYIGILLGYSPEACDQRGVCGRQLVVEADGSVYPCDFYMLDSYKIGNFNENRLNEIEESRESLGFIAASKALSDSCRSCRYLRLCKGGCRRHRESNLQENLFCESYKAFFSESLEKMQEVADCLNKNL